METWGVKLYQDDVALDTKEEYLNYLRVGYSNEETTELLIEQYTYDDEYDEDCIIFYLALADTQWKYGRLLPKVKERALMYIDSKRDLDRWQEDNPKLYPKREKELEKLKQKLLTDQPPLKNIAPIRIIKSKFKAGDVISYRIHTDEFKNTKYYNKYAFFRVVGYDRLNIGSLPFDIYYDEWNKICLYNVYNNSENIKLDNYDFIDTGYPVRHHYYEIKRDDLFKIWCSLDFSKKEIKELGLNVIYNDDNYKKEDYFDNINMPCNTPASNKYCFELDIVKSLNKAEKDNNLFYIE